MGEVLKAYPDLIITSNPFEKSNHLEPFWRYIFEQSLKSIKKLIIILEELILKEHIYQIPKFMNYILILKEITVLI